LQQDILSDAPRASRKRTPSAVLIWTWRDDVYASERASATQ